MGTNDLSLLDAWRRHRDPEAFREIVSRHASMVYGTCRRILGNTSDAEDVTQECFIRVATDNTLRIRTSLAGWLHRSAIDRAKDLLRSQSRRRLREQQAAEARDSRGEGTDWNDIVPLLDGAIERLPRLHREIVVGHYLEQRTYDALAEDLGVSRRSVVYRSQKAIEQIRSHLRSRGVQVAVSVLATFLAENACEAAPPALLAALGKIAIGGVQVGVGATSSARRLEKVSSPRRVAPRVTAVTVAKSVLISAGVLATAVLLYEFWPASPAPSSPPAVREVAVFEPEDASRPSPAVSLGAERRPDRGDASRTVRTVPARGEPVEMGSPLAFIVSGRVTDSLSGEPVPGAVIRLGKDEFVLADEEGEYRCRRERGKHSVTASAEGYARCRKIAHLNEPGETRVDLALATLVEVLVRVVDTEGFPVADVKVTPSEAEHEGIYDSRDAAQTDPAGEAIISRNSRFGASRPRILVEKRGYSVVKIGDLLVASDGTLRVEITVERLDENLRAVEGRVTRSDGIPLPGALVTWNDGSIQFGPEGVRRERAVASDADGYYRLEFRHRERAFNFAAHLEGFAPAWRQDVRAGTAREPAGLDFALRRGHTIEGRVADEQGEGLEGVQVEVRTRLHRNLHHILESVPHLSTTDDRGHFALRDLSEGPVTVHLSKPGWSSSRVAGVEVDESHVFTLRQSGVVHGRVLNAETGEAVRSFTVKIENGHGYSTDRKTIGETFHSSDGRFVISGLQRSDEPTHFTFKIESDGYVSALLEGIEPQLAQEAEEHEILLSAGQAVTGTVVDGVTGEPLADVKIYSGSSKHEEYVWNDRRPQLKDGAVVVQTDESGLFRFQESEPQSLFVHRDRHRRVVITPGERWKHRDGQGDLRIRLAPGESVSVTVVPPESGERPQSLTLLRLREGGAGERPKRDVYGVRDVAREANFLWNTLSPGRYLIALNHMTEDGAWVASIVYQQFSLGEAEHRSVRAGENLGSLRFQGRIVDTMNRPLVNSRLILNPLFDWGYVEFEGFTSGSKTAEFSIPHLKPGRYAVSAGWYSNGRMVRVALEPIELRADTKRDLVVDVSE